MSASTTALAPVASEAVARADALRPVTLQDAITLVKNLAGSQLLPVELRDPPSLFLMVLQAADLGLSVPQAIRGLHIIKGKPVIAASLMVGLCQGRKDVCDYFECVTSTDTEATWETRRKGRQPKRRTFTMDDAKRAGLLSKNDGNWQKYPRVMLKHRASSELATEVYADLLYGVRAVEDVHEDGVIELVESPAGQYTAPPPSAAVVTIDTGAGHYDDASTVAQAVADAMSPKRLVATAIAKAKSLRELEDLVPALKKLPEADREELRPAYGAARKLFALVAEAPAVMGGERMQRAETSREPGADDE